MNQFLEKTLSHLTGNSNIDQVSIEELESLTKNYPYFPVGHMLLSKKLKSQADPRFLSQVQKTALYFSNPYWLHYQLLNDVPTAPVIHDERITYQELEEKEKGQKKEEDILISEGEPKFPPATPKFSKNHITASSELAKVVLADGDDNIDAAQLIHGPSSLLEPTDEIPGQDKEVQETATGRLDEEENLETVIDDQHFEEAPIIEREPANVKQNDTDQTLKDEQNEEEIQDVPITTEFSLEEIKASDELAHETLADVESETDGESKFILTQNEEEIQDVPITTEFSLEEIQESGELAHETLADVESETDGEPKFILPQNEEEIQDVPITTEFSLEEIQESGELAHETLADVESETEGEPKFILPESGESLQVEESFHEPITNTEEVVTAETIEPEISSLAVETIETNVNDQVAHSADHSPELPHVSPEAFSNEEMLKNIKSILDTPLHQDKPVENEPLIPIEPYYTVDYFASLGIKLVLEKDPKDKLGRQLKSFTQWLKHMKKLGPEDALTAGKESEGEATIPKIADSSNTQREVVTEAMAEVLEMQGKADKAIQVYIKLSFLYPDKSAYFADKIKNLKGIK